MLINNISLINQNCVREIKEGFNVKKNHLVFPILLLILSVVLIMGYVNQTQQTHRKETVQALVQDAAILIEDKGENAFSEFRQEGTKWFHGDTYVFVWRTDGIRVVYPPDPSGEGQNMSTLVDVTGKAIGRQFIDIALSEKGQGWIAYSWPKPGEIEPSIKQTYIKGVATGDQAFLVGSGFYLDKTENVMKPLQYVAIIMESIIAATGLLIAVRKKRFFGYGIFLTFIIYVFYDLSKLIPIEVSDATLYPIFFVATLSILWVIILIYKEK
jgi:Cache domain